MSSGKFFSIELDAFHDACALGLNAACLYLVMAMGTDRSGVKTAWSCNSLETRTSISRRRAKEAQGRLLQAGLIRQTKAGKHPRFNFVLQKDSEKVYWPNEFIDGASDEIAPLELMRQDGDVMALRLLVDLYSVTNFADDGGVNPDIVWQQYEGEKTCEVGEFAVWGFCGASRYVGAHHRIAGCHNPEMDKGKWDVFWDRLQALQNLGLCRFVPVLFDGPEGEIIHHLENPFTGESMVEITCWAAANLVEERLHIVTCHSLVIPIHKHIRSPVVKGVLALTYRQKTQLTAAGFQATQERWDSYQTMYDRLRGECTYQGYIKGKSKEHQG